MSIFRKQISEIRFIQMHVNMSVDTECRLGKLRETADPL